MDIREEKILGEDVGRHWYYQAKADFLRRTIGSAVFSSMLDVGAGSGFFSRWLLTHTPTRRALCVDSGYVEERDVLVGGKRLAFRKECSRSDADLVLMMDVLEHVDDDVGLLAETADKVSAGTPFIITVPALPWLWSAHDEALDHRRRYTLEDLQRTVVTAGLEIERLHYLFGLVLPIAAAVRLAERFLLRPAAASYGGLKRHAPAVKAFLLLLCVIEGPLARFNRMAGLTLICRCKKSDRR